VAVVVERVTPERWEDLRQIRLAALADAPGAFLRTYDEEEAYPAQEWQRRAADRAVGDEGTTFLAFVDGDAAGIVGAFRWGDDPDTAELVSMWTAPPHRRAGVGRALSQAVVDWARDGGASKVVLWVVRGNDRAQTFYESVGFEATDDIIAMRSDPCREEQRMVLRLS
jgi:GNAT superfamily N-acetyltransferase